MITRIAFIAVLLLATGCSSNSNSGGDDFDLVGGQTSTSIDVPPGYEQFLSNVRVYRDGASVAVQTDNIPNHNSPYFGTGDDRYETPQAGMVVNPNRIAEQDIEFRLPAEPSRAGTATETQLGAIGVALNGVVFYNQYAGRTATGWLPLDNEIATFDQYNGHPQQFGAYHYHLEPVALTAEDDTRLIGFMMDGYPIYGPRTDAGALPSDLDACNGHTATTSEYPDGTYHYHATASEPYLVGCFRGEAGSVTQ